MSDFIDEISPGSGRSDVEDEMIWKFVIFLCVLLLCFG